MKSYSVRHTVAISSFIVFVAFLYNSNDTQDYSTRNNVCSTIHDYHYLDTSPNCWHDPDVHVDSNVTQIIINNGYGYETHEVITEDGHILTVFRVINQKGINATKGPFYFQHGLSGSSINFVGLGKESLAFVMSDAGYDVWMGNARGSIFSRRHVKYTDRDPQFWNHSYHEMAVYDIPAVLKHVRSNTNNEKIIYLGYSMGTTQALVYSSVFPEQAKEYVKLFVFFSPVSTNNLQGIFGYEYGGPILKKILQVLPDGFFDLYLDCISGKYHRTALWYLPMNWQVKIFAPYFKFFQLMDTETIRPEAFPKLLHHGPHGNSLKTVVHLLAQPKEFRMFDYGPENINVYGTEQPPKYNLSDIKVPIYMYYSEGDEVSSPKDTLNLYYNVLSPEARFGIRKLPGNNFTHLDYAYGANVKTVVYEHLLEIIKDIK